MQFFHYQKYKSVSPKYFYFLFFESTKENFEGRIIILLVAVRGFRASRDRDQAFEALENSEAARLDIGSLAGPFSIPLHGFIQSTTRVADERVSERARAHSYPLLVFAVTPVRLDVLPAWANRLFFFFFNSTSLIRFPIDYRSRMTAWALAHSTGLNLTKKI